MAFTHPATAPDFFGITWRHWQILADYARSRKCVLCIRCGKRAAVPWIERGFPAKSLDFKECKVDPHVGLLRARTVAERSEAARRGYPVLEAASTDPAEFVAKLGGRDAFEGARFNASNHGWLRLALRRLPSRKPEDLKLIIDPHRGLPITSDYDLAAIVDTANPDYYLTYASWAGSANRTNPHTSGVVAELNRLFGTRRIMHGTEAQYSGGLAHGNDDAILAFHPDSQVEHFAGMSALDTDVVLQGILLRYSPEMAPSFRQ
jgi:hypothetical protein